MADEGFKRKLAAILSADVKGYSRLMEEDEEATIRTLTEYRDIIAKQVKLHKGRVVDSPGDNVLADFASVVDALKCAVQTQNEIDEQNENLPVNRKMEFRIGLNLGDVAEEHGRIYGDGVNVAARIESLADPGGICISRTAYDQVRKKLTLGYEYLGEHSVKNIDEPVRVYRVLTAPEHAGKVIGEKTAAGKKWRRLAYSAVACLIIVAGGLTAWNIYLQKTRSITPASKKNMAFPLPDKPSIAVLPFANMSGDPKQEYLSDGLTEDIITALSKSNSLLVIARNSTFTYKGKPVKVQQVAENLGVRYVLEGSIQIDEDKVRITAQLIDAVKGYHVWSERYDRDLKDIFALQDDITKKILTALRVKLTSGEDARIYAKSTDNLEAYLKSLEGYKYLMLHNEEANHLARQMFNEAIALDPNYSAAYQNLAWTYVFDVGYGWTKSRAKSLEKASEYAEKALALDDSQAYAYAALSAVHVQKGELKEAVALREKAVDLVPNSANYHALLGLGILWMGGRTDEAIQEFKIANRLDPFPPNWILYYLGVAYRVKGEYDKAIEIFKKVIKRNPDYWLSHLGLAACYGLQGREEEARAAATEVLRIRPNFSIAKIKSPYRDPADKNRTLEVLRKAGLK